MNCAYTLPFRSIGKDVVIWDRARIVSPEVITIGDSVIIDDFVLLMGGTEARIGSFVHIAAFSSLVGGGLLILEDFAGLSGGCRVFTGNEDYGGGSLTNPAVPAPYRSPVRSTVVLKKHCIVGANSVILPGVTGGEGAVVGANSLIKEDCQPWTVYVGTPAKPVRERPSQKMLELEKELRSSLYDPNGNYLSTKERT